MDADEEADGLRTNAYNKALSVKDEFFHSALYDWYLAHGITDQLLEASRTPLRALPTLLTFPHCFDRLGHPTSRHTFLGSPRPCRRRTFCGSTTCERRGTPTRRRSSPASLRRFCKSFGLFPGSSQAYHLFLASLSRSTSASSTSRSRSATPSRSSRRTGPIRSSSSPTSKRSLRSRRSRSRSIVRSRSRISSRRRRRPCSNRSRSGSTPSPRFVAPPCVLVLWCG